MPELVIKKFVVDPTKIEVKNEKQTSFKISTNSSSTGTIKTNENWLVLNKTTFSGNSELLVSCQNPKSKKANIVFQLEDETQNVELIFPDFTEKKFDENYVACPKCQTQNLVQERTCTRCGSSLRRTCLSCFESFRYDLDCCPKCKKNIKTATDEIVKPYVEEVRRKINAEDFACEQILTKITDLGGSETAKTLREEIRLAKISLLQQKIKTKLSQSPFGDFSQLLEGLKELEAKEISLNCENEIFQTKKNFLAEKIRKFSEKNDFKSAYSTLSELWELAKDKELNYKLNKEIKNNRKNFYLNEFKDSLILKDVQRAENFIWELKKLYENPTELRQEPNRELEELEQTLKILKQEILPRLDEAEKLLTEKLYEQAKTKAEEIFHFETNDQNAKEIIEKTNKIINDFNFLLNQTDKLLQNQNYKEALEKLEEAQKIRPINQEVQDKIKLVKVKEECSFILLWEKSGEVNSVTFSPDGRKLASGSGSKLMVWNSENGSLLWEKSERVKSVTFSPDGKKNASVSDSKLQIWNSENGLLLWEKSERVKSVTFSPDGKKLAPVSEYHGLQVWNSENGSLLWEKSGTVNSVTFSPDGKKLASVSKDYYRDYGLQVWNSENGSLLWEKREVVNSVTFSPDGRKLALGNDSKLQVCNSENGSLLWEKSECVKSVTFSPDGKKIAFVSVSKLEVWNSENGSLFWEKRGEVDFVTFSPDGRKLASVSKDYYRGYGLQVCNSENGSLLWEKDGVKSVTFSPDGKKLALKIGDNYRSIKLEVCNSENGSFLWEKREVVDFVTFSPDGKKLALRTGRKLEVWKVPVV